ISTIGLANLPSIGMLIGIAIPSSAGFHSLSLFLMYQPLMLMYLTPSLATNSITTLVLFDFLTSPIFLQLFHINFLLIFIAPFQDILFRKYLIFLVLPRWRTIVARPCKRNSAHWEHRIVFRCNQS